MAKFYYRTINGLKKAINRRLAVDYSIDRDNNSSIIFLKSKRDKIVVKVLLSNILPRIDSYTIEERRNRFDNVVTVINVILLNEPAPPIPSEILQYYKKKN